MKRVQIDLLIEYWCGCKVATRTAVELPDELSAAERTESVDRAIIEYIEKNYDLEHTGCPNKHRSGTYRAFRRIVEILN